MQGETTIVLYCPDNQLVTVGHEYDVVKLGIFGLPYNDDHYAYSIQIIKFCLKYGCYSNYDGALSVHIFLRQFRYVVNHNAQYNLQFLTIKFQQMQQLKSTLK